MENLQWSEPAELLLAMVREAMRERGKQKPEDVIGASVGISAQVTDAVGIPPDAEQWDARLSNTLGSLNSAGYLVDVDGAQSASAERKVVGYDYRVYTITERGVAWLRGLGVLSSLSDAGSA